MKSSLFIPEITISNSNSEKSSINKNGEKKSTLKITNKEDR